MLKEKTLELVDVLPEDVIPNLVTRRIGDSDTFFINDAPEEQLGKYTIRKWTWYERQQAVERASVTLTVKGDVKEVQVSASDINSEMLASCVKESPIENWGIDFVKTEIDSVIGEVLMNEVTELNGLTWAQKRGFLRPSAQTKDTRG